MSSPDGVVSVTGVKPAHHTSWQAVWSNQKLTMAGQAQPLHIAEFAVIHERGMLLAYYLVKVISYCVLSKTAQFDKNIIKVMLSSERLPEGYTPLVWRRVFLSFALL